MTRSEINAYFVTCDLGTMSCPQIDLPEQAIDHFGVRDDIMEVDTIHRSAQEYLKAKQHDKSNRKTFREFS